MRFNDLLKHYRTHTGERPFKCNICSKRFSLLSNLIKHKREHNNTDLLIKCEYCNKIFLKFDDLMSHYYLHIDNTLFKCDICNIQFCQSEKLKKHKLRCTN